jgi:large subunit ribosomal protein L28
MARTCEICGKHPSMGNNVSHANNKSRRRYLPNLQPVTLISDALGRSLSFRVTTHALRSVEHNGGLDNFLLKARKESLSPKARRIKHEVEKRRAAA